MKHIVNNLLLALIAFWSIMGIVDGIFVFVHMTMDFVKFIKEKIDKRKRIELC